MKLIFNWFVFLALSSEAALGLSPSAVAAEYQWTLNAYPDTGQTKKYLSIPGEDADYENNPPSYTDNQDGSITDNVTGLMWQQGESETVIQWANSSDYCNTLNVGHHSDWRMPTSVELMSIIDNSRNPRTEAPFNPLFVSAEDSEYWWSSTPSYFNEQRQTAWLVNAGGGIGNHPQNDERVKVRCVRDADNKIQTLADRFLEKDGLVLDRFTHLLWEKRGEITKTFIWEDAIQHCENLEFAGFSDWRLPNHKELKSINEEEHLGSPTIYEQFILPEIDTTGKYLYWSSTSLSDTQAWYLEFSSGLSTHRGIDNQGKSSSLYVRCVRYSES